MKTLQKIPIEASSHKVIITIIIAEWKKRVALFSMVEIF